MIATDRLELIPLDERQLGLWCHDIRELERELGCIYRAEPMEGAFLVIVKDQLEKMTRDFDNYLWRTFWLLKDKESGVIVGAADFKNAPDKDGTVEIGYAAGEDFRKRGYITEAVCAMCEWALRQPGVNVVTAETEAWNRDSHEVLKRCGFEQFSQGETFWWRLRKDEEGSAGGNC